MSESETPSESVSGADFSVNVVQVKEEIDEDVLSALYNQQDTINSQPVLVRLLSSCIFLIGILEYDELISVLITVKLA